MKEGKEERPGESYDEDTVLKQEGDDGRRDGKKGMVVTQERGDRWDGRGDRWDGRGEGKQMARVEEKPKDGWRGVLQVRVREKGGKGSVADIRENGVDEGAMEEGGLKMGFEGWGDLEELDRGLEELCQLGDMCELGGLCER